MNIKSLFAKLLIGIVPFITGCSNLPVKVPIDLSKEGDSVEFEAVITKADRYQFMLYFYLPKWGKDPEWKKTPEYQEYKKELDALYDFVGDSHYNIAQRKHVYTGQIIPIHVTIYKINKDDKELISDEIYNTQGYDGLALRDTGDYRFRWFASYNFKRGRYLIRAENIKGFEFMKNRRSEISLLKYRRKY